MTATRITKDHLLNPTPQMQDVAQDLRAGYTIGGLMTLGARNLRVIPGVHKLGGLAFDATILPMKKDGTRAARAETMTVITSLTPADSLDIDVLRRGGKEHTRILDLFIGDLQRAAVAIDYNGDEVLNPRYM